MYGFYRKSAQDFEASSWLCILQHYYATHIKKDIFCNSLGVADFDVQNCMITIVWKGNFLQVFWACVRGK